jgi:hypothetical protein
MRAFHREYVDILELMLIDRKKQFQNMAVLRAFCLQLAG